MVQADGIDDVRAAADRLAGRTPQHHAAAGLAHPRQEAEATRTQHRRVARRCRRQPIVVGQKVVDAGFQRGVQCHDHDTGRRAGFFVSAPGQGERA
ncbi:hypothetical protein [Streptosporangium sp. NPDC003464]